MIRKKIQTSFPHHLNSCTTTSSSLYVADYTEKTKNEPIKRGTELFEVSPPSDIDFFTVNNQNNLMIEGIPFDNNSFTYPNGDIASQCECVIYPSNSNKDSWILFIELKYSNNSKKNKRNLNKAKRQLFKTQYHYKSKRVFDKNNTCYLLASLPMQTPPFANSSFPPGYLAAMKKKHNVIIRFQNSVEIIDDRKIKV